MISFALYMLLGGVLAFSGINVVDRPLAFVAIMAIVVGIDFAGRK